MPSRAGYNIPRVDSHPPSCTIPEDNSLALVPLVHDFMPEYGIASLPDCKKIVKRFIKMASSEKSKSMFDL